ncbi:choline ABC transporter substrate-binding protein [Halanaerocella petrolearia]
MMRLSKKSILLVVSVALVFTLLAGCGQQNQKQAKDQKKKEVTFGYINWPGVTVKTEVAVQVLESLGYDVKTKALTQNVLFEGMKNDEIDAFLGNWYPSMKAGFEPYQKKGVAENVTVNLEEAIFKTAVPKYVWDAGVKSMADLNKYADKFDHQIVGIEPGNSGNVTVKKAIDNNTYNLKDWKVVTGSTAAMLSAVGKATRNKEWIAFNGWQPHWMNLKYDIKYLKDPEGIWGASSTVYTTARPELKDNMPNFYKFLEQLKVNSKIQDKWILEYQKKGRPTDKVAQEWIATNLDVVKKWVKGMKTVDGKDAVEAVQQQF